MKFNRRKFLQVIGIGAASSVVGKLEAREALTKQQPVTPDIVPEQVEKDVSVTGDGDVKIFVNNIQIPNLYEIGADDMLSETEVITYHEVCSGAVNKRGLDGGTLRVVSGIDLSHVSHMFLKEVHRSRSSFTLDFETGGLRYTFEDVYVSRFKTIVKQMDFLQGEYLFELPGKLKVSEAVK